jgi:hypothetical protein
MRRRHSGNRNAERLRRSRPSGIRKRVRAKAPCTHRSRWAIHVGCLPHGIERSEPATATAITSPPARLPRRRSGSLEGIACRWHPCCTLPHARRPRHGPLIAARLEPYTIFCRSERGKSFRLAHDFGCCSAAIFEAEGVADISECDRLIPAFAGTSGRWDPRRCK